MKKLVSVFLVAILILPLLVCSPDGWANTKSVTLKFWGFQFGAEDQYLRKMVNEFNDSHKNIKVEYTQLNQTDYTTTLIPTAFANGEAPDIMFVEPATFLKYASKGMLADLTPYISKRVVKDYLPSTIHSVTYKNKIMALPYEMELLGLFYNKDMLNKAGISVPKTWDELYAAAKKLTTDKVYGLVLPVDDAPYTIFNFWPFLWMSGGDILNKNGSKSVFSSRASAKALDFWAGFFKEGLSPKKLQIGPYDIGNIGTGVAAMQVSGTYVVNAAETTYKNVNIGVAPLPTPDGKNFVTVGGGQKLAANGRGKHVKEAAEFIVWMYGSDDISRMADWCTKAKFAYPARQSVIKANTSAFHEGLRAVFTDEIYSNARPEPSYSADITNIISKTLQKVMFGGVSSAKAAKEADTAINASMKK
jgi:multiple sugar transport system substrate-binding protein